MATSSELLKGVGSRLVDAGFTKRAGDIYTLKLMEGIFGWVGLNTGRKHLPHSTARVNPVIGVRHEGVEKLVFELGRRPAQIYLSTTISRPIGYIMPRNRYVTWELSVGDSDVEAKIVEVIVTFGIPFMIAHQTLPALLSAARADMGHGLVYRIPLICYLMGDLEGAREAIESQLQEYSTAVYPAAEKYRAFAQRLNVLLSAAIQD